MTTLTNHDTEFGYRRVL